MNYKNTLFGRITTKALKSAAMVAGILAIPHLHATSYLPSSPIQKTETLNINVKTTNNATVSNLDKGKALINTINTNMNKIINMAIPLPSIKSAEDLNTFNDAIQNNINKKFDILKDLSQSDKHNDIIKYLGLYSTMISRLLSESHKRADNENKLGKIINYINDLNGTDKIINKKFDILKDPSQSDKHNAIIEYLGLYSTMISRLLSESHKRADNENRLEKIINYINDLNGTDKISDKTNKILTPNEQVKKSAELSITKINNKFCDFFTNNLNSYSFKPVKDFNDFISEVQQNISKKFNLLEKDPTNTEFQSYVSYLQLLAKECDNVTNKETKEATDLIRMIRYLGENNSDLNRKTQNPNMKGEDSPIFDKEIKERVNSIPKIMKKLSQLVNNKKSKSFSSQKDLDQFISGVQNKLLRTLKPFENIKEENAFLSQTALIYSLANECDKITESETDKCQKIITALRNNNLKY